MESWIPSFFLVFLIIFVTGILGGLRNWAIEDVQKPLNGRILFARIVDAVIAAASIPLFLSVIGNEKIADVFGKIRIWEAGYQQAVFILVGFCSLAALFSQRFLESLSKRVMQLNDKLDRVEKKVDQTNTVTDNQIEPDLNSKTDGRSSQNIVGNLTEKQTVILKALASGQFLMRSKSGLSESSNLAISDVDVALKDLSRLGLAQMLTTSKGERWALTDEGRLETIKR